MRNVNQCANATKFGLFCVFARPELDESNYPFAGECFIGGHDTYNLFPETDENGDFVSQTPKLNPKPKAVKIHGMWVKPEPQFDPKNGVYPFRARSSDPIPFGVNTVYEDVSHHDTGLSYITNRHSGEPDPRYHITERLLPHHSDIGEETPLEVIGENNIGLVASGWESEKVWGFPRVEPCMLCLYGKYDQWDKMFISRHMREYTRDIKDWIDFSCQRAKHVPRELYVVDDTEEKVNKWCKKNFKGKVAKNMFGIFMEIKNGEYINLKETLLNNGMDMDYVKNVMSRISVKSRKLIFSTKTNLLKLYHLYNAIGLMGIGQPKEVTFKSNILNYVLNSIDLENISINSIDFPTHKRFWYAYMLAIRALGDGIMTEEANNKLPKWFSKQVRFLQKHRKRYQYLGEMRKFQSFKGEVGNPDRVRLGICPPIDEGDAAYVDCIIDSITDENGEPRPSSMFPGTTTLKGVLGISLTTDIQKNRYNLFKDIVVAGQKWYLPELKVAWEFFQKAAGLGKPVIFWEFIGKCVLMDSGDLMETLPRSFDEFGQISQGRVFAHNLLECWITDDSLAVKKQPLASDWVRTGKPRGLGYQEQLSDLTDFDKKYGRSWIILAKIGGLKGDKNSLQGLESAEDVIDGELGEIDFCKEVYGSGIGVDDLAFMDIVTPTEEELNGEEEDEWPNSELLDL